MDAQNQSIINSNQPLGSKWFIFLMIGAIYELFLVCMSLFTEKSEPEPNNVCDELINKYCTFFLVCNGIIIFNILSIVGNFLRTNTTIKSLKYLGIIHLLMAIVSFVPLFLGCTEKWFSELNENFYVLNTKIYLLIQIITCHLVILISYSFIIASCLPKFSCNCCKNICKRKNSSDTINDYNTFIDQQ